jgi:hypothetical protein
MRAPGVGGVALAAALARLCSPRFWLIDLPLALARRAVSRWL